MVALEAERRIPRVNVPFNQRKPGQHHIEMLKNIEVKSKSMNYLKVLRTLLKALHTHLKVLHTHLIKHLIVLHTHLKVLHTVLKVLRTHLKVLHTPQSPTYFPPEE